MEQLGEVPLFAHWRDAVLAEHPQLLHKPGKRLLFEVLRRLLSAQLGDLVASTAAAVAAQAPADADAVRAAPLLARLSDAQQSQTAELKRFLFRALYRHPQVLQSTGQARTVIAELYAANSERPVEMQADYADAEDRPRAVADYIAGMTDRYALREHHRLTGRRLFA